MASQVVEQLQQLESLCERLYLSQVRPTLSCCQALAHSKRQLFKSRQNVFLKADTCRSTKNALKLSSTSEYLCNQQSLCLCARYLQLLLACMSVCRELERFCAL